MLAVFLIVFAGSSRQAHSTGGLGQMLVSGPAMLLALS